MRIQLPVWTLSFGLVLAIAPFSLSAQQGTLVGTVTDVLTRAPVPLATIQILGGGERRTVLVNNQGQYRVELPAGTYDLVVEEVLSYRDERFSNVRVSAGETNTYDLSLTSDALAVVGINVTVERSIDGQAPGHSPQSSAWRLAISLAEPTPTRRISSAAALRSTSSRAGSRPGTWSCGASTTSSPARSTCSRTTAWRACRPCA